ncbi:hypothetical protein PR002_g18291 [Phytophthora rubi]|uniref:Uncharacterized protein n=1 Tax=Phytophthora rubi TaxID=129364 RepID=A0A6A3K3D9_9STRA|nr:hypothetical protein PR002_g18291 [Phytophthora rubi]
MNRLLRRDFAAFWNVGYVVGDIGISDELCERALQEVEALSYVPIFRDVYNRQRDQFRRQANDGHLVRRVGMRSSRYRVVETKRCIATCLLLRLRRHCLPGTSFRPR